MKRLVIATAVVGAAAVLPASSGAATLKGTVVAKERGKLLVAMPGGTVRAVTGRASVGSRVAVSGSTVSVVGRARTARLRGIVIRRLGTTMVISSNHHVLAIRGARRLASVSDTTTPAAPGDVVATTVTIAGGELDEDETQTLGHAGSVQIQAQVVAVGAGTVTLLVNGTDVPVQLPAGLTLPQSLVGQTVTLTLNTDDQDQEQGDDEDEDEHDGGGDDD